MNKIKYVFLILFLFTLFSCKKNNTLSPPTNLQLSDMDILSWDKVKNADKYLIEIEYKGKINEYWSNINEFDIFEITNIPTTYKINVSAYNSNDDRLSNRSEELIYEIDESIQYYVYYDDEAHMYNVRLSDKPIKGKVIIPSTIQGREMNALDFEAIKNRDDITSIYIYNGIMELQSYSISSCDNLKRVYIPNTVSKIEHSLFVDCNSLKEVTLENSDFYRIENNCIISKEDNMIVAAYGELEIPRSVDGINRGAIEKNNVIENIVIPNNIKVMVNNFWSCSNLKNVIIEEGVEDISGSFQKCPNLKYVKIPSTIIECSDFYDSPKLETIESNNDRFIVDGNSLIDKETNTLMCGTINSIIPNYIEIIPRRTFFEKEIETIIIPSNVKTIEYEAFDKCLKLKSVIFEEGIETIERKAFRFCYNLKNIFLPKSLKTLDPTSFDSCYANIYLYDSTIIDTYSTITSPNFCSLYFLGSNDMTFSKYNKETDMVHAFSCYFGCEMKDDYLYKINDIYLISWFPDSISNTIPEREGYKFVGLSTDEGGTNIITENIVEHVDYLEEYAFVMVIWRYFVDIDVPKFKFTDEYKSLFPDYLRENDTYENIYDIPPPFKDTGLYVIWEKIE